MFLPLVSMPGPLDLTAARTAPGVGHYTTLATGRYI